MPRSIKDKPAQKRQLTEDEEDAIVAFERKDEPEVPGDVVLRENGYDLAKLLQEVRVKRVQPSSRKRQR